MVFFLLKRKCLTLLIKIICILKSVLIEEFCSAIFKLTYTLQERLCLLLCHFSIAGRFIRGDYCIQFLQILPTSKYTVLWHNSNEWHTKCGYYCRSIWHYLWYFVYLYVYIFIERERWCYWQEKVVCINIPSNTSKWFFFSWKENV
jgi:hypothetical protein